jgi:hypothetical protein
MRGGSGHRHPGLSSRSIFPSTLWRGSSWIRVLLEAIDFRQDKYRRQHAYQRKDRHKKRSTCLADGGEQSRKEKDSQEGRHLDEDVGEATGRAAIFRSGDHRRDGHAVGRVPVVPPKHGSGDEGQYALMAGVDCCRRHQQGDEDDAEAPDADAAMSDLRREHWPDPAGDSGNHVESHRYQVGPQDGAHPERDEQHR